MLGCGENKQPTNFTVRIFHSVFMFFDVLTRIECLRPPPPTTQEFAKHFEHVAVAFYNGEEIPEEFESLEHVDPASPAELDYRGIVFDRKRETLWGSEGAVFRTHEMSTFLIDLIIAREMEKACTSKSTYFDVKVRRHSTSRDARDSLEDAEKDTTTNGTGDLSLLEKDEDKSTKNSSAEVDISKPWDMSKLPELANPPVDAQASGSSVKNKKKNKKNTLKKASKKRESSSHEDPILENSEVDSAISGEMEAKIIPSKEDQPSLMSGGSNTPGPTSSFPISTSTSSPTLENVLKESYDEYNDQQWETVSSRRSKPKPSSRPSILGYFQSPTGPANINRGQQNQPRSIPNRVSRSEFSSLLTDFTGFPSQKPDSTSNYTSGTTE